MAEFHGIRRKWGFPHIFQDLGKQLLEEKGRHEHVKSKTAVPRITENTGGREGEELHQRSRRKRLERALRAEQNEEQKRLCITYNVQREGED